MVNMNMMVNTSDLAVNEAETNKLSRDALNSAVSKLVASWERKQAKKMARVGGLGFLAISLAACNSSSDDTATTTTTTPTTTTPATPAAPTVNNVTIAAATTSVFGKAGENDIMTATGTTLTGSHIIADSDTTDSDSLTVVLDGDYTLAPTVVGIEDVNFTTAATLAGGDTTLKVNVNNITASGDTITFDVTTADTLIDTLIIDNAGTNHYSASSEFATITTNAKADADIVLTIGANATIVNKAAADDYTINGGAFNVTVSGTAAATEDLVVTGKDVDVTFGSILGNVNVSATNNITDMVTDAALGDITVSAGNDITTMSADAAVGTATLTAGNDIKIASVAKAKTIVMTAKGAITLTDGDAATTLTMDNTGGTVTTDGLTITDADSATTVTLTSVGAITATNGTGLHAATTVTATAAKASSIDLGANDATINLNADASAVTNTPEVAFTITGVGTGQTFNLGGVTAIALKGAAAQFSGMTVTSTNSSAAISLSGDADLDVSKIATSVPIRFDVDYSANGARTISKIKNDHVFQFDVETTQNGGANATTFKHETDATATTTHSLTINVIDSVTTDALDNLLDTETFVFTDFNTVNIDIGAETVNFDADVTGADVDKYVVTGSGTIDFTGGLNLQGNAATSAAATEFDASGMTGGVTGYTLNADSHVAEIVKTGSGVDTITIAAPSKSTNAFSISTGAKGDSVTYSSTKAAAFSYDGGSGTDTLILAHDAVIPTTASLTSVERITLTGDTNRKAAGAGNNDATVSASWITGKSFLIDQATNDYDLIVTMDQTALDLSGLAFSTAAKTANDTIIINAGTVGLPTTIVGSSVADVITGTSAADNITGGEGVDTIQGEDGADIINITETTAAADIIILDDTGATDKITGWKTGSDKIHIDISAYATELGANAKETIITGAGGHAAIASAINTLKDVADGATVTLTNEDMVKVTDTTGNNSNADLTFTIKNNAASSKGAAAMLFTWYDANDAAMVVSLIQDTGSTDKNFTAGDAKATITDLAMVYMNTTDYAAVVKTDFDIA
jgi:hypothetical protein